MAEALVSFVVNKLGDFAAGRAERYRRIRDDSLWLKGELSMMQALLRDAERRSAMDETVKEWLQQVRSVAFKIEDFLDLFPYVDDFRLGSDSTHSSTIFFTNWNLLMRATDEIEVIKKEVECIARRAQTYGLHCRREEEENISCSRAVRELYGYSTLFEEADLVGFDEDVTQLTHWLLREDDNAPWSCMCIAGMGGSGKTALAKRVYNLVHNHFDHHLWETVSEYSQVKDFSRAIQSAFQKIHPNTSARSRYVLVLDDASDINFCGVITHVLPSNSRGRIILTSRQNIAASLVDENCHVDELKPLPCELAWELFCKKAFRCYSPPGICPEYLNDMAIEIVRRCSGLPLAIVLMGGLMSRKGSSPRDWKAFLEHFNQELLHNPHLESINHVFQASYFHLPLHLQYCFFYACLFPKGSEIRRKKIIRLWVAQGFVKERQGKTMEEVADDYLIKLIEGSMLEPIYSNFTGRLLSCRVHDIMHELAVCKFKEEFGIFYELQLRRMMQTRYLAIHHNANVPVSKEEEMKARALLVFGHCNLEQVLPRSMFLRVLCLDGTKIEHLPDQVCDLCHLTYLGLRETLINDLPNSLEKLHSLQTLDVRGTNVKTLPSGITNIRKLRHLLLKHMELHSPRELVMLPRGAHNLHLLQTLAGVKAGTYLLSELSNLIQLKKLYIRVTGQEETRAVFIGINQIVDLYSLKLECHDEDWNYTELMLEESLPLPEYLEKLTLGGIIMELPQWFARFESLRVLHLVNSMLIDDPLSNLSKLPNLMSLSLFHAYTGEQMGCKAAGFPRLQHLQITGLIEFKEWAPIAEGTMPCILFLRIVDCYKLNRLPQGFEQLKTLQSLELIQMSEDFTALLTREDLYKVQHISKITDIPRRGPIVSAIEAASGSSTIKEASTSGPFVEATRKRNRKN